MALIYALLTSISTYLAGISFGFLFFTQTPFYILILLLIFPFTLSLSMISFFVSTLAPTLKAANASSYAIVLLAIVVQSFVSDNNILTFIFTTDPSAIVSFLKVFLIIYPPFSYTKVTIANYLDIYQYYTIFWVSFWYSLKILVGRVQAIWYEYIHWSNLGPLAFWWRFIWSIFWFRLNVCIVCWCSFICILSMVLWSYNFYKSRSKIVIIFPFQKFI